MCAAKCQCICVIQGDEQEVEERIRWINKKCCNVVGVKLEANCVFSQRALDNLARKIIRTKTIRSFEGHVKRENWTAICEVLTKVARRTKRHISIALFTADFTFSKQVAHGWVTHMRDTSGRGMVVKWGKIPN